MERPHATPRTTYTFAQSFADKAREAAAQEARETEEREAEEAHMRAERDREAYERSLLVSRFSGMSVRDDTAARSAAYEEEDKLRGMEVAPAEETTWQPGTPPYPPTPYIPGVDGPAVEESKGGWDDGEQEEAW